jgi:glycosyltransferase involved in cell wall biosynthesis
MKYSLIIGTLNRSSYIKRCLESILNQTYTNYEIIIVDQSTNDETENLIKELFCSKINYIRVNEKGLSRARNTALRQAKGDYFCLIDDDAYYREDYLFNIEKIVGSGIGAKTILTGYLWNQVTSTKFVDYDVLNSGMELSVNQILRYAPSPALIFPSTTLREVGFFDEQFGVGAIFGACEETDYIIRCREKGYRVVYDSNLFAYHPMNLKDEVNVFVTTPQKHYAYSKGKGAFFKKHLIIGKEISLFFPAVINFLNKLIKYSFRIGNKENAKAQLSGFISGYTQYKS